MARFFSKRDESLWKAPGSLIFVGTRKMDEPQMDLIQFNQDNITRQENPNFQELAACFSQHNVSWLNINGLHDTDLINKIGDYFNLHPLLLEDVLNSAQRSKFEEYDNYLFFVLKMLKYDDQHNEIFSENLSIVIGDHYIISFQEANGDVFDPIRDRLLRPTTKIRTRKSDYLAYALMDAVVDNYIYIVERYGERIENLEKNLINHPNQHIVRDINYYKMELNFLRKTIRPVRELIAQYAKSESKLIETKTFPYLKDLMDHITHAAEAIETYRDMIKDQLETYQTNVSNRLNDIIRVLTMFSVIFIPITFVAGVYGTNFEHFPELEYKFAYPIFWGFLIFIAISMLIFFRHKKWL